ncbi:hypothetical protein BN1864_LIB5394:05849 [Pseudomonas sp. 1 R 17]|nr:hypothetical protein BN1864_LIB5394:05849 [Pseudomonas sp. 1 R 17]
MGHALDGRPLAVRLQKRIQKFQGCTAQSLVTDMALHQQSLEAITECVSALKALAAHYGDLRDGESLNVDAARSALAKYRL